MIYYGELALSLYRLFIVLLIVIEIIMKNKFSCCVLLPVFNNKKGLIKSLKSIDESIDLTVYIIDDGSLNPIKINSKAV